MDTGSMVKWALRFAEAVKKIKHGAENVGCELDAEECEALMVGLKALHARRRHEHE